MGIRSVGPCRSYLSSYLTPLKFPSFPQPTYTHTNAGRDTKKESGDRALVDRVRVTQRGVLLLALALYAASSAFACMHLSITGFVWVVYGCVWCGVVRSFVLVWSDHPPLANTAVLVASIVDHR